MSILFYYSLLLSGALLLMWGACRTIRGRYLVLGRGVILSAIGLAVMASALPILHAEPIEIVVSSDVGQPLGAIEDTATDVTTPTAGFSWWELLCKIYIIGVAVSLLLLSITILRIARIIMSGEARGHIRLHDDSNLVPFAWGNWVIMSRSDYEAEGPMLLVHEAAHLRGLHWIDLLALNLLQCITWYCPAVRLLRGELLATHEYIADKAVLSRGFSARDYQLLLISKASGRRFANSVTACINHVSLKNRILMMQNQTNPGRVAKRALALIPAGILLVALAFIPALSSRASALLPAKTVAEETVADPVETGYTASDASKDDDKVSDAVELLPAKTVAKKTVATPVETNSTAISTTSDASKYDDKVFDAVEIPPQFPDGEAMLLKFVQDNMHYPVAAITNGIQGRVILKFVIEKDGSVGDVKVLRSVDPELDAEAVRIVKSFPKFTPGRMGDKPVAVNYVIPITFKLSSPKK